MSKILFCVLFCLTLISCRNNQSQKNEINTDSVNSIHKINELDTIDLKSFSAKDSFINIKDLKDLRLLVDIDTLKVVNNCFVDLRSFPEDKQHQIEEDLCLKIKFDDTLRSLLIRFNDSIKIPNSNYYIFFLVDNCARMTNFNVLSIWEKYNDKFKFISLIRNKTWLLTYSKFKIDKFIDITKTKHLIIAYTNGGDAFSSWGSVFWGTIEISGKFLLGKEFNYALQADYNGIGTGTYLDYKYLDSTNEIVINKYKRSIVDSINLDKKVLIDSKKIKIK